MNFRFLGGFVTVPLRTATFTACTVRLAGLGSRRCRFRRQFIQSVWIGLCS